VSSLRLIKMQIPYTVPYNMRNLLRRSLYSERIHLFMYFGGIILCGSLILILPGMWKGADSLSYLDALFTSTSAVCVTGLITVDTAQYSRAGQVVILILMEAGGLGLITFATLLLATPKKKISFVNAGIIKKYYIENVEFRTSRIVRNIVIFTLFLELLGSAFLYIGFKGRGIEKAIFVSLFHAVSAFCNAGFSTFSNNLESFSDDWIVNMSIMCLIVSGGLGFLVIQDISRRIRRTKKRLQLHSTIVIRMTVSLIFGAAALYYIFEREHAYAGFSQSQKILASLFQSVTTRTAGFDTVNQAFLSLPSKVLTIPLMFIGGSSGSTAGGIKTTTAFLVLYSIFKGTDKKSEMRVGHFKISSETINNAFIFTIKALMILFISMFTLIIAESRSADPKSFLDIMFECVSAFGTVGLSLGITAKLTAVGKVIIILTMFAGRVGLIAMAIPFVHRDPGNIDYPKGEVLVG